MNAPTITLMNGVTEIRVRSSEGCTVLGCGCASTDVMWLQMCFVHHALWSPLHAEAARAHSEVHS